MRLAACCERATRYFAAAHRALAEHDIEPNSPAAMDQEMEHHDCPEQRVFEAFLDPGKTVRPVMRDRREQEDEERDAGKPREEAGRQQQPAEDLGAAEQDRPEHARPEAALLQEGGRARRIDEQLRIAVRHEREPRDDADQRFGIGGEYPIDAAECRNDRAATLQLQSCHPPLPRAPEPAIDGLEIARPCVSRPRPRQIAHHAGGAPVTSLFRRAHPSCHSDRIYGLPGPEAASAQNPERREGASRSDSEVLP